MDRAQRGQHPGLLGGGNGSGQSAGLQGLAGQPQQGNGGQQQQALPSGLADQLRSIIQQLEAGEGEAQPAGAGQGR